MRTPNRLYLESGRQLLTVIGLIGAIGSCVSAETAVHSPTSGLMAIAAKVGEDGSVYNFGALRIGKPLTHIFMLKNATDKPVLLSQAVSSCDCTSAIILDDFQGKAPLLAPGDTARVRVDLDSAKLAEASGDTLPGGVIEKQILVYTAGEQVHPAATLTLRGRLTRGVAFDPPTLSFGDVDEAKGAKKSFTVTYDADVYTPGKSHLQSEDSRVQLMNKGSHKRGGQIVARYTIAVKPHAPIGDLSGVVLAKDVLTSPAAQSSALGLAAFSIPYVGQITGNVAAEPRNIVFGNVKSGEAVTDLQRTRWILLVNTRIKKSEAAFWSGVVVEASALYLEASVVTPLAPAQTDAKTPSPALPPDMPTGYARWLKVTIRADAPHKQLMDQVTVSFPDKERVVLPVYGQVLGSAE
jgi:hypothetical protein